MAEGKGKELIHSICMQVMRPKITVCELSVKQVGLDDVTDQQLCSLSNLALSHQILQGMAWHGMPNGIRLGVSDEVRHWMQDHTLLHMQVNIFQY